MHVADLTRDAQNKVYEHSEANEWASKFAVVNYDVHESSFTVLGYDYDDDGICVFFDSKEFYC